MGLLIQIEKVKFAMDFANKPQSHDLVHLGSLTYRYQKLMLWKMYWYEPGFRKIWREFFLGVQLLVLLLLVVVAAKRWAKPRIISPAVAVER